MGVCGPFPVTLGSECEGIEHHLHTQLTGADLSKGAAPIHQTGSSIADPVLWHVLQFSDAEQSCDSAAVSWGRLGNRRSQPEREVTDCSLAQPALVGVVLLSDVRKRKFTNPTCDLLVAVSCGQAAAAEGLKETKEGPIVYESEQSSNRQDVRALHAEGCNGIGGNQEKAECC